MDSGGAIFARIPLEKRDEFVRKASDMRSRWADFKSFVTRDEGDLVLLKRYDNRDDVPGWTPRRENAGEPLAVPNSVLAEISALGGEVIAFFWVEEWFDYQHWVSGKLVRFIDGGVDGWDTVSGVPEPWERDCFFPPGSLEKRLADLREGNELTPERETAIAGAWSENLVKSGAIEPPVDVRALLKALEKHFGIWLRD